MTSSEAEIYVTTLTDEAVQRLELVASLEQASQRLDGEENELVLAQIDEELHGVEVALEAALTQWYKDMLLGLNPTSPKTDKCRIRTSWAIVTALDSGVETFYGVHDE